MRLLHSRWACAALAWAAAGAAAAGPATPADTLALPLDRPALMTPRATGAVLLGLAQAGPRWVAVGERGVVLLSDDQGATWRQTPVPTSVTLTAVGFASATHGWAIGHSGVVLATRDAGSTWVRQLDGKAAAALALAAAGAAAGADSPALKNARRLVAEGADKPFLALHFFDERRGFVIGAYGLAFGTEDGGRTWASWLDRLDNPKGLHLNALAVAGDEIVICGEQGLLLRSSDAGKHFRRLASPYEGSWFAAALLPGGRLLVAGLRGNAWLSDDHGDTFVKSDSALPVTLSALSVLPGGSVLALNQAGQVLVSRDQGKSLQPLGLKPGPPLTQVAPRADGQLLASSLRGVQLLPATRSSP